MLWQIHNGVGLEHTSWAELDSYTRECPHIPSRSTLVWRRARVPLCVAFQTDSYTLRHLSVLGISKIQRSFWNLLENPEMRQHSLCRGAHAVLKTRRAELLKSAP